MTIEQIEETGLWRTAFSEQNCDKYPVECHRLRSELWKFREKAGVLVKSISAALPGLTIHDLSHLDALWQVADLIAGKSYPLNPLEAFVLGGAILLHDSAMCWEAYVGGQAAVRGTVEWLDAYAVECDRSPQTDDAVRRDLADFAALRSLHAHQAEFLPGREWNHPDTGTPIFLIDDPNLRTHLGPLIGKIASSHHWNIDVISPRLGDQFNAPPWLPSDWWVDPVKIACLLRCADAAHVNQARAPDFMYSLVRRAGISRAHWQAQNRMFGPTPDADDLTGGTITYTSSIAYGREAVSAWWVAYDAVSVIQNEIQASNNLLRSRSRPRSAPEFTVREVRGANSVEGIRRFLQVEGWIPCSAQIHVTNIERLVKNLGGEKLYGDGSNKLEVVVRELIQNARDAIIARRYVDADHDGTVAVKIEKTNDGVWLSVEDDGVGMSYSVLTGALLDFGTSFWSSALIQDEFPGMRSSGFKSIGQFGIGFFSVFMIADSVSISSRRWEKGLDEAYTLSFADGLTLRPVVQKGRPQHFSARASTVVRLKLKDGILPENEVMKLGSGRMGVPDLHPLFLDYLSVIVCGLDVRVTYESRVSRKVTLTEGYLDQSFAEAMLVKLSLQPFQHNSADCLSYIKNNSSRLRPVLVDGEVHGFAAISTRPDSEQLRLGLRAIGGLATAVQGGYAPEFVGFMNYKPQSARREGFKIDVPEYAMESWYLEQLEILSSSQFGDYERCVVAINACELGFDPYTFGRLFIVMPNGQQMIASYEMVASIASSRPVVIFKSMHMDHAETYCRVAVHEEHVLIRPLRNANHYLSLAFDDAGVPKKTNSIIGCLHRAVIARGDVPVWTISKSRYEASFGGMEELTLTVLAKG
jgi:hypothetical protein